MTLQEALQRWSDACTVEPAGKDGTKLVPSGNRRPLMNQLRHCAEADIAVVAGVVPLGWSALVLVTPAEPKPHADSETPLPVPPRRKPFYLFVG